MFIGGVSLAILAAFLCWPPVRETIPPPLGGMVIRLIMSLFGMVGFVDDYVKVVKKRNLV